MKSTKFMILVAALWAITIAAACGPKPPVSGQSEKYLTYYTQAHEYFEQNKPHKAIPLYQKTIKEKANFAQAYQELAVCYQQIGDDSAAIASYEGAIVFNPRNVDAYQSIGNIHYVKQEYDEALVWYEKGSDVDFLYPRTYNNMASIWFMRGDLTQAKKYWNQAISVDATYPRAYYGLGLVAIAEKDTIEAEAKLLDAIRVGSMPEAMYTLGTLYYDLADYQQAESWLNRYLEKEPAGQWSERARDTLVMIEQKKNQK